VTSEQGAATTPVGDAARRAAGVPAAVWLLALGTVVVGTDAYVIAGILPEVSSGLGVTVGAAGQLITVFAVTYALAAPCGASLAGGLSPRIALSCSLGVFAVGAAATACAPGYPWALAARVVAALGASSFTPQAITAASALAGPARRARALSVVVGGITVAALFGVPLGTLAGGLIGWRWVLGAVAVLAVAVLAGIARRFPAMPAPPRLSFAARGLALRNPVVVVTLTVSLLTASSEQLVYAYIGPILGPVTHHRAEGLAVLLFTAGVGGLLGNAVAGAATERHGARATMLVAVGGMTAVLAAMPWWSHSAPAATVAVFIWGLTGWMYVVPQQHRLLARGGDGAQLAVSLNSSALYLGAGIGGAVGGMVLRLGTTDTLALPAVVLGVLSLIGIVFGYRDAA
jgi:predicted MFS family arabinose efflux permease